MIKTKLIYAPIVVFALLLALTLLSGCETLPKDPRRFDQILEQILTSTLPQDRAKEIMREAESGDAEAQFILGMMYDHGQGVHQDYKEAVKWYAKAAEQGQIDALFMHDFSLGMKETIRKAESGDAEAQFRLGRMFEQGLGRMFDTGRFVRQDYKEAVKWYTKAAEQGDAGAQNNLGQCYRRGQGVPQDYKEALMWLTMAAEQGLAESQNNLGAMYYLGEGVPQDYVQAYKWFNLASAQGHEGAKHNLEIVKNRMSPTQIAEAQRLSRDFRPRTAEHSASAAREPSARVIKSSGTGFFITADGYLLTAYHVVKESAALKVWTDGRLTPTRLVRVDAANDIALLKVDELTTAALRVISSRNVRTGLDVFTLGFPNIQLQGTEVKYTQGNISSLTGAGDDPRLFQISVPVQPGNSGGPLLDEQGQVIGVVIAKLDEIFTARATGSLPQNVNYALKSSFVLSFLESLPELSGKLVQTKNSRLSRTKVVDQSCNAVVMVLGY
jgi:TPR repeat protein